MSDNEYVSLKKSEQILWLFNFQPLADLTIKELSKLSREITPDNMRVIAREYLDFQHSELETLWYSRRNDVLGFKFEILHTWKTKHVDNNREVSSHSFLVSRQFYQLCLQT